MVMNFKTLLTTQDLNTEKSHHVGQGQMERQNTWYRPLKNPSELLT